MAIYLITPLVERPDALLAALERLLPAVDRYALPAQRGWLVRFAGTSVELSNHLGITGGPPGAGAARLGCWCRSRPTTAVAPPRCGNG